MLRFWDEASVRDADGGFEVLLDGPALRLRSAALADAIAAEWQTAGGTKGGEMSLDAVPLTRLAGTAQERVARDPAASVTAPAVFLRACSPSFSSAPSSRASEVRAACCSC